MLFVCYPKCTTCQKAKKWLQEKGIEFEERNIKENNPTMEELKNWHKKSGLPLKKFFNTSGQLYRELKLKDKLPAMSEEEQFSLLASDGMLVKRPLLIGDDFVLVGFKEAAWKEALGIEQEGQKIKNISNKTYFLSTVLCLLLLGLSFLPAF